MLRRLSAALAAGVFLAVPSALASESMRQFHAETATSLDEIVRHLQPRLPTTVTLLPTDEGAVLTYTGNATPDLIASFAEAAFETLPSGTLDIGRTLSLALTMSGREGGTDLSLMVLARFPEPVAPLPDGSVVILDGLGPGRCQGQQVLRHPGRHEEAARAWRGQLEQTGFVFPEAEPDEVSFFIGYAPNCSVALYLKPDQGTTLIVVRYLED